MDLIIARDGKRWSARFGTHCWLCAIGPAGVRKRKREGDGATPSGRWPLRRVLYRADRVAKPATVLPCAAISRRDGWCDEPADPHYNRPVDLPYTASHERLWRDDELYDVVVVLGYNDDPPVKDAGSCIFLHVARPDYAATQGCIALARDHVLLLLREASQATCVVVPESG